MSTAGLPDHSVKVKNTRWPSLISAKSAGPKQCIQVHVTDKQFVPELINNQLMRNFCHVYNYKACLLQVHVYKFHFASA